MKYRFELQCPECCNRSSITSDRNLRPNVKCGECLMERIEIVTLIVVSQEEA